MKYNFSTYTCESATQDAQSSAAYNNSCIQWHAEYSKPETLLTIYTPQQMQMEMWSHEKHLQMKALCHRSTMAVWMNTFVLAGSWRLRYLGGRLLATGTWCSWEANWASFNKGSQANPTVQEKDK